jgi:gliding motility-associated-like protein
MKQIVLSLFLLVILQARNCYAQLVVSNALTPAQLVQSYLVGPGVVISNVTFSGNNAQRGFFNGLNTNLGLDSGLVLSTGAINGAVGPNNSGSTTMGYGALSNDPDLNAISTVNMFDAAILEFDFIPNGDTVQFRYIFASEEYPEFSNPGSTVVDAFGLFLSGPGIVGPYSNGGVNIALVPGTTTPVSIVNISPVVNTAYYVNNGDGSQAPFNTSATYIQYDGRTVILTAKHAVQCGETYHLKFAIADGSDDAWDSGVFLEAGSLSSNAIDISAGVANGDTVLYEGCNSAFFAFNRPSANTDFTVNFIVGGTATNGMDYPAIPDSLVMPIGIFTDTIFVNPYIDGLIEDEETVTLMIIYELCAGQFDTISASLTINDYSPLWASIIDSINICPGEVAALSPQFGGGMPPLSFLWSTGDTTTSINVVPEITSPFTFTVSDNCIIGEPASAEAIVWVQCPIIPPNVFTPNNDGENDFFKVENLDDYLNPHLIVYNRWGKVVYDKENYQNDWDGTHYKNGKELPTGVYYYIVTPNSPKYEYNELSELELKRTVSGYVHLMR